MNFHEHTRTLKTKNKKVAADKKKLKFAVKFWYFQKFKRTNIWLE